MEISKCPCKRQFIKSELRNQDNSERGVKKYLSFLTLQICPTYIQGNGKICMTEVHAEEPNSFH